MYVYLEVKAHFQYLLCAAAAADAAAGHGWLFLLVLKAPVYSVATNW